MSIILMQLIPSYTYHFPVVLEEFLQIIGIIQLCFPLLGLPLQCLPQLSCLCFLRCNLSCILWMFTTEGALLFIKLLANQIENTMSNFLLRSRDKSTGNRRSATETSNTVISALLTQLGFKMILCIIRKVNYWWMQIKLWTFVYYWIKNVVIF